MDIPHDLSGRVEATCKWLESGTSVFTTDMAHDIRARIAELEAALADSVTFAVFDGMRGKWLHEKDRAEQAEAALAVWERRAQNAGFKALEMATAADKAEAALAAASTRINDLLAERTELMLDLAQRDRMLRLAYEDAEAPYATVKELYQWLADLRTRAEEGSA